MRHDYRINNGGARQGAGRMRTRYTITPETSRMLAILAIREGTTSEEKLLKIIGAAYAESERQIYGTRPGDTRRS